MSFKQANNRRKRPRLNPYTPQSNPPIYTSVTFSSRREGGMKASRRHIIGAPPSGVQLQPEASYQDLSHDFVGDDIDFGYMDDDTPVPSKRRRTAAVSIC